MIVFLMIIAACGCVLTFSVARYVWILGDALLEEIEAQREGRNDEERAVDQTGGGVIR